MSDLKVKIDNTTSEEVVESKYRNFMLLLYPDTTSYNYNEVLSDIVGSFKKTAYILHQPEKEESKRHNHLILFLDNPRSLTGLASRLGIPVNHIKVCRSKRQACRYLTHRDNPEKIQYDLTDCFVSRAMSREFYGAYDDLKTEEDVIEDIYCFIDSLKGLPFRLALKNLVVYVNNCFYDTLYKRFRPEFTDYLRGVCSQEVNIINSYDKKN